MSAQALPQTREALLEAARAVFAKQFGRSAEAAVAAPGRANLIGEHTDYNDGHVLPIAIDRFTVAAAAHRNDTRVRVYSENLHEAFECDLDAIPADRPGWASYIIGVLAEMRAAGHRIGGKDIAVFGNVPMGSGLSSSAALEISVATAVERLEGLHLADADMVAICRRADHHFVGIQSGPMDQFASRACRAGHAGLLDCRSLEMTHYPLPGHYLFLSVYSGIPRALANSEYNERLESCRKAVALLQQHHPDVRALRDASPELLEQVRGDMDDRIYRRARHVITEQQRVFALIEAMQQDDAARIGEILKAGHDSLSRDYEVSLPILDEMIDWLYRQPGIIGARLTGAGFGGSLITVAERDRVDAERVQQEFLAAFGDRTPEPPQLWPLITVDGAKYA